MLFEFYKSLKLIYKIKKKTSPNSHGYVILILSKYYFKQTLLLVFNLNLFFSTKKFDKKIRILYS